MIRNNQNGRRRGRGGARPPQAGGGGPSGNYSNGGGNRVDVRQRGNATQLLEKYKALARDATQGGDRVQAEYFMQYADHYYRVLNEFRARDPQPAQRPSYDDEDGDSQGYNGQGNGQNYAAPQAGRYADESDDDGDDYDAPPRREVPQGSNREAPQASNNGQGDRMRGGQDQRGPRTNGQQRDGSQRDGQPRYAGNRGADQQEGRAARETSDGRSSGGDRFNGSSDNRDFERPLPQAAEPPRGAPEPRNDPPATDVPPMLIPGLPGPATVAATEAVTPAATAVEVPAPRRRGRPRKVVVVPSDDIADT